MRHKASALMVMALVAAASAAVAQAKAVDCPLDSGRAVRLHLADGGQHTVRLLATFQRGAGQIRYCTYPGGCGSSPVSLDSIPSDSVVALDAEDGDKATRGTLIGGAVGGLIAIGASALLSSGTSDANVDKGAIGSILVAGGATAGFLVGSSEKRWKACVVP